MGVNWRRLREEGADALRPEHFTILTYAARGWTSQQIADELDYTMWHVQMLKRQAMYALDARNTTHAVAKCIRTGRVIPPLSPRSVRRMRLLSSQAHRRAAR